MRINRLAHWIALHWFATFIAIYGIYISLPFLAPVFMHVGWDAAGRVVYFIYSFLCHQLPERSYFLFGPKLNYSLAEVQAAWQNTGNPLILRQFIGNAEMGWKVAWSDRMVSMFSSIWLFALLWFPFRRRVKPLSWQGFALLLLPMALDGTTHAISDLAGIGHGFRDTNLWLAALTHNAFAPGFYAGDAWDSFNGLLRLLTGALFGLGVVWVIFPYVQETFPSAARPDEGLSGLPARRGISPLAILLLVVFALSAVVGALLFLPNLNQGGMLDFGSLWPAQTKPGVAVAGLQVGQQVPDFTLKILDGKQQVSLSDFTGKAILINFWASWCIPCRSETPLLENAYQSYQKDGLVILGVNMTSADSISDIRAFVAEFKMTYPVLLDQDGRVAEQYRVIGIPTSFFINRRGLITRVQVGEITQEKIESFLAEILANTQ